MVDNLFLLLHFVGRCELNMMLMMMTITLGKIRQKISTVKILRMKRLTNKLKFKKLKFNLITIILIN